MDSFKTKSANVKARMSDMIRVLNNFHVKKRDVPFQVSKWDISVDDADCLQVVSM